MARGLSMFDAEQRLIVCNKLYREIYDLPEELTRPGTPLADIVRYHFTRETGRDTPEDRESQRKWIEHHVSHCLTAAGLTCRRTLPSAAKPKKRSHGLRADALTEVPNRFHFHEELQSALQRLNPGDGLAVHWIDLDEFKNVNDEFGHPRSPARMPRRLVKARLMGPRCVTALGTPECEKFGLLRAAGINFTIQAPCANDAYGH